MNHYDYSANSLQSKNNSANNDFLMVKDVNKGILSNKESQFVNMRSVSVKVEETVTIHVPLGTRMAYGEILEKMNSKVLEKLEAEWQVTEYWVLSDRNSDRADDKQPLVLKNTSEFHNKTFPHDNGSDFSNDEQDQVIYAIKKRASLNLSNYYAIVSRDDAQLYSQAKRYFGSWKQAVLVAGLVPQATNRNKMSRQMLKKEMIRLSQNGERLLLKDLTQEMRRAVVREFGGIRRLYEVWGRDLGLLSHSRKLA